ncbi:unnamed protein product, partial [Ectocarpus sp. 12 AP-2014]
NHSTRRNPCRRGPMTAMSCGRRYDNGRRGGTAAVYICAYDKQEYHLKSF